MEMPQLSMFQVAGDHPIVTSYFIISMYSHEMCWCVLLFDVIGLPGCPPCEPSIPARLLATAAGERCKGFSCLSDPVAKAISVAFANVCDCDPDFDFDSANSEVLF